MKFDLAFMDGTRPRKFKDVVLETMADAVIRSRRYAKAKCDSPGIFTVINHDVKESHVEKF